MSGRPIRVLVVENQEDDAELIIEHLRRADLEPTWRRVDTAEGMRQALREQPWDVILCDYVMPHFSGADALELLKETGLDVPFIIVSGRIGEEVAVHSLKLGAQDFFRKDRMKLLGAAVERELREAEVRRERNLAKAALEKAERERASERQRLIEELRAAIRLRDEFLLIAAHELRTPLTSLKLQFQGMTRRVSAAASATPAAAELPGKLRFISRQVDRLSKLIESLLDVSRMTSGHLVLERERFDLAELAREVASRFEVLQETAGCVLRVEAPGPVLGNFDRVRMDNVLMHLLSNAFKFGAGKPVDLQVEVRDRTALLTVRDRGIGISEADQHRIFQRFERAVPETHYGGFGVGLWIARQVVEAHGGHIKVRSQPERGAAFVVSLPLEAPG